MHAIETSIPTNEASRYLQQLCKHWSHRFAVTFTSEHGRVPFSESNSCTMVATPETLNLRVEATDAAEALRLADVVIQHLQRFAFRAPLEAPAWRGGLNRNTSGTWGGALRFRHSATAARDSGV